MPRRTRVVIADDHPIILKALRDLLASSSEIAVVAEVTSFDGLFAELERSPADAVILDIYGMRGTPVAVVERLRRSYPSLRIVIFSSLVDMAPELLRAGAHAYITKLDLEQHLLRALNVNHSCERYVSPVVEEYLDITLSLHMQEQLHPKELTVLKLLARGLATLEIAEEMAIRPHSVQNYVTRLRQKTGAVTRTQLAQWYRDHYGQD